MRLRQAKRDEPLADFSEGRPVFGNQRYRRGNEQHPPDVGFYRGGIFEQDLHVITNPFAHLSDLLTQRQIEVGLISTIVVPVPVLAAARVRLFYGLGAECTIPGQLANI